MPLESKESLALFCCMMGLRFGLCLAGEGVVEGTYGRRSVSSVELNNRIDEPLFGIFVGVLSFGVFE